MKWKHILALLAVAGALSGQSQPGSSTPPAPAQAPVPANAPEKPKSPSPGVGSSGGKEIAKVADAPASAAKTSKAESLRYTLSWATGLDLGQAILTSAPSNSGLNFGFQMDASLPGFSLSESAESRATTDYCSTLLYKRGTRGKRKVDEKTEFDPAKMTATRRTEGGGKSEISTQSCAKDALAFLFFLRRELVSGRLPSQQKVYYGAPYGVHVKFAGTQQIQVAGEGMEADKLTATIKGASDEVTADLFFSKDPARTPLLVQVPLKVGTFSLELVR